MTHIPDEAVQAPERIRVAQDEEGFWTCREAISGSQEYIRADISTAHLSAPCAVEVMELNWVEVSYGFIAHTAFGTYKVKADVDQFIMINSGSEFPTSYHDNHFEAKAAAQADFERRILSCIVTKPVDVAAVRRQAFEEGFENGVEQSLNVLDAYDDITRNEAEQGIMKLKPDYRALSAEPAQGGQWQPIDLVGDKERLIIIGSYNAKGLWCAEVWHTQYLRDQQEKSADGFFMNAPHLEWIPTHFMDLPAAPTTEAGRAALAQGGE